MIVRNYKLESFHRQLEAFSSPQFSYRLFLNGERVSENIPALQYDYFDDATLLQIHVCDACFSPGCSYGNYFEVLSLDEYVIWKYPDSKLFSNQHDIEIHEGNCKFGNIVWARGLYEQFSMKFDSRNSTLPPQRSINANEALELWTGYIAQPLMGNNRKRPSLEVCQKNAIAFDSNFEDYFGEDYFFRLSEFFSEAKTFPIESIHSTFKNKFRVFFDIKGHREASVLFGDEKFYYFPIEENLFIRIERPGEL